MHREWLDGHTYVYAQGDKSKQEVRLGYKSLKPFFLLWGSTSWRFHNILKWWFCLGTKYSHIWVQGRHYTPKSQQFLLFQLSPHTSELPPIKLTAVQRLPAPPSLGDHIHSVPWTLNKFSHHMVSHNKIILNLITTLYKALSEKENHATISN